MKDLPAFLRIPALVATVLCLSVTAGGAADVTRIAAVVNDQAITQDDLNSRIRLAEVAANQPDTPDVRAHLSPTVLKALIDEQLELQEAEHDKITVADSDIDASFAHIAQQNKMTPEQFTAALEGKGVSMTSIRAQIKAQVAWIRVVQKTIRPQIDISSQEIDAALDRIKSDAGKPQYLTAEIFLAVDSPEQEAAVKATADRLVDQLRHGGNFALAARQFSQSAGAATGGDLGWIQQGQLPKTLEEPLEKLRPGEITDPVSGLGGYHILLLRDRGTVAGPDAKDIKLHLIQVVMPVKDPGNPASMQQTLAQATAMQNDTTGCDAGKAKAQAMNDGVSGDLGDVSAAQLPPQIAGAVQNQPEGKFAPPLRTPKGYLLLMLCKREAPAANLPSRDDMANQIGFERMDQQQRRFLRDLRASAYVDIRA